MTSKTGCTQIRSRAFLAVILFGSQTPAVASQESVDLTRTPAYIATLYRTVIVTRADVPFYPVLALEARISGEVRVKVTIQNGEVVGTTAVSSAHILLTNAASENIRTWRFLQSVTEVIEVTFLYVITKNEGEIPQNPRIEMELPSFVRITATPVKHTVH